MYFTETSHHTACVEHVTVTVNSQADEEETENKMSFVCWLPNVPGQVGQKLVYIIMSKHKEILEVPPLPKLPKLGFFPPDYTSEKTKVPQTNKSQ